MSAQPAERLNRYLDEELPNVLEAVSQNQPLLFSFSLASDPAVSTQALFDPIDGLVILQNHCLDTQILNNEQAQHEAETVLTAQAFAFDFRNRVRAIDPSLLPHDLDFQYHANGDFDYILKRRSPAHQVPFSLTNNEVIPLPSGTIGAETRVIDIARDHARFLADLEGKEIMSEPKNRERDAWAEIDGKALHHNVSEIRRFVGDNMGIIAMVKANAYGHGDVEIARQLEKTEEVSHLGVVCVYEVRKLREANISLPIIILNDFKDGSFEDALQLGASITVMNAKMLKEVQKAAEKLNTVANIHMKSIPV